MVLNRGHPVNNQWEYNYEKVTFLNQNRPQFVKPCMYLGLYKDVQVCIYKYVQVCITGCKYTLVLV